jgi:hypothetical protein
MGILNELGITKKKNNKAELIFDSLHPSFLDIEYLKPIDYILKYWNEYKNHPERNNNLNGKIFEYILATLCIREKILPIYLAAEVSFVPNVIYDLMFYTTERGPICWSVKTSLRERYGTGKACLPGLSQHTEEMGNATAKLGSDGTATANSFSGKI